MEKKQPVRMCIACREHLPKHQLIRIVKTLDDTLAIDRSGKLDGRGAYLCANRECLELALKKRALERAFRMAVGKGYYDTLREELCHSESQ